VVGFSVHGLAVARALARQGVPVHCLSDSGYARQPTTYTRYAQVHLRRGLNTDALPRFLAEVADEIGSQDRIVLFPTSDRIVKAIANAWGDLSARYAVSWSHCRDLILQLQRKDRLAEFCERAGVRYPRSTVLREAHDCESATRGLQYPLVVKPAQPLSSFKAIRVADPADLRRCVATYPGDLPFVVQEWVEGPEPSLYACTTYLDRGKPLCMFTSRKLAASPPGLGQGTVFETVTEHDTVAIAERFLRPLDLSGPVAVEFKRDATGQFWLIEPNVGRTEYCVDLAIQSGVNLPYIEYLHVTGRSAEIAVPDRTGDCVWFDTDKDPACFIAHIRALRDPSGRRREAIFPFLGHQDLRPVVASVLEQAGGFARSAAGWVARPFRPRRVRGA